MDGLKSLGAKVAPFMPVIGGLLGGPGGAVVAGALAKQLGAPSDSPDVLEEFLSRLSPQEKTGIDMQFAHERAMAELKSDTDIAMAQIDLNKTETQHSSLFVAGWRPFIGWSCGAGIAYHFILRPISNGVLSWKGVGCTVVDGVTTCAALFPPIDTASLSALVFGMLGLGVKRTIEKINGVARGSLRE